ncbi:acyl-CoA thioesterase [Nocardioides houyundeii]|uniref:acyl-CoA thioesterase n=1 Tax=Nocardioides houyundeii TaxID=2045452 RepID=UPI000DF2F47C|nr:acyl-CoA thioesterase domain-containing protein [Nocardioides houyundeii]
MPVQWGVPFGGLLVAQALAAATATTASDLWPRSLHAYFVGVGSDEEPVDLRVADVADSKATAWRSVDVSQGGRLLLRAEAMFSRDRPGPDHARTMPQVPAPDDLTNVGVDLAPYPGTFTPWGPDSAFDLRHVDAPPRIAAEATGPGEATSQVWLKAGGADPGDPRLAAALLAYASDMCMLDACLRPAGLWFGDGSASGLTLDHSMWFHAPARVDDWLLLDLHSPAMRGGRGLGVADIYARDGELLCSVAQLGSIRPQRPATPG